MKVGYFENFIIKIKINFFQGNIECDVQKKNMQKTSKLYTNRSLLCCYCYFYKKKK